MKANGKALSNFDINGYFGKKVHYPRDQLPNKLNDGDIFIINTDDHRGPGEHFVALKNVNKYSLFFDSFGMVMLPEVLKLAEKRRDKIINNTYRIQAFDSVKCGYFCIDFLENVFDYKSYHKWLLNYSPSDFKKNDETVMKRLNLIIK